MDVVIEMSLEEIKGQEEEFKASIVEDIAKGIQGNPNEIEVRTRVVRSDFGQLAAACKSRCC